MIKAKQDIHYGYKEKERTLTFLTLEGQTSIFHDIGGWFGETLHHLLQSKDDLQYERRWNKYIDPTPKEVQQDFLRLISTLTEEGLLEQKEEFSLQPLLETEWTNFGKGDFKGSMTKEKIEDEELIAYAHTGCHSAWHIATDWGKTGTDCFGYNIDYPHYPYNVPHCDVQTNPSCT